MAQWVLQLMQLKFDDSIPTYGLVSYQYPNFICETTSDILLNLMTRKIDF